MNAFKPPIENSKQTFLKSLLLYTFSLQYIIVIKRNNILLDKTKKLIHFDLFYF